MIRDDALAHLMGEIENTHKEIRGIINASDDIVQVSDAAEMRRFAGLYDSLKDLQSKVVQTEKFEEEPSQQVGETSLEYQFNMEYIKRFGGQNSGGLGI